MFCDAESVKIWGSFLTVEIISLLSGYKNEIKISNAGMTKRNLEPLILCRTFFLQKPVLQDYVSAFFLV